MESRKIEIASKSSSVPSNIARYLFFWDVYVVLCCMVMDLGGDELEWGCISVVMSWNGDVCPSSGEVVRY